MYFFCIYIHVDVYDISVCTCNAGLDQNDIFYTNIHMYKNSIKHFIHIIYKIFYLNIHVVHV
jgi:hypothetical protein